MKVTAQLVSIECKCGGMFIDDETYSADIRSDTKSATCVDCGKRITDKQFPKTARLFV